MPQSPTINERKVYESAESDAYEATMTLKHMAENLDTERVIGFFNAQREDED